MVLFIRFLYILEFQLLDTSLVDIGQLRDIKSMLLSALGNRLRKEFTYLKINVSSNVETQPEANLLVKFPYLLVFVVPFLILKIRENPGVWGMY